MDNLLLLQEMEPNKEPDQFTSLAQSLDKLQPTNKEETHLYKTELLALSKGRLEML